MGRVIDERSGRKSNVKEEDHMFYVGLGIGMFIGCFLGVLILSICIVGREER
jgi:hypothetical protein